MLTITKPIILKLLRRIDDWVTDRTGPVRVLLVVRNEIGFVNQAPLLQEMGKYPEIMVHTTSDGDQATFNFSDNALQKLYEAHEVPAERAVFMKWHYLITTDVLNLYFRRDAIHVSIGHGCSFGNGYRKDDWRTFEIMRPDVHFVFGMSSALRNYVEAAYPGAFDPSHRLFFPTGFAKLDNLYNGAYSRKNTLSELGLSAGKKTILVASHWGEFCMLRTWGKALLEALLPLDGQYNIILTSHPKLWEFPESAEFSPDKLWVELKEIETRSKSIRLVKSGDPLHLLNAADLLICGNSSIRVEYALLDRPALFYKAPAQNFSSPEVQKLYEESSHCFNTLDNLSDLAVTALQQPELLARGQQKLKDYFHENPGKGAATMVDIIRKVGRIASPMSPRWKIAQAISEELESPRLSQEPSPQPLGDSPQAMERRRSS